MIPKPVHVLRRELQRELHSAGVSFGSACSNCATAPHTTAAAMLEPDNVRYVPPFAPTHALRG